MGGGQRVGGLPAGTYIACVPPDPERRILLVRFSSLGDLVLVTPLIRAIRARHPRAHLALVTRQSFAPLFVQNPHLNEVMAWDPDSSLAALAARIRAGRHTDRLDLHGSLRTRLLRLMVPGRWGRYPKHRLARTLLIRTKRNRYRDTRHVAERYFDAARRLDVEPDGKPPEVFLHREAVTAADRFLAEHRLGQDRTLFALVPGAAHATKRWPERHWVALVRELVSADRDLVILGGSAEEAIGARLAEAGGAGVASAAGRFDLQGTAALLRRARAAVSGDTGLMHLATAVGTPVLALRGPTVAAFGFGPYSARARVIERDLPCRPCSSIGGERCPLGHHDCLETIFPLEVADALRTLPR